MIALAVCEIGSLSERRIAMLVDPALSGMPAFLTPKPGLNSGFMIPQVTAAALVSENKQKAYPASVDSIPTSANQEDHVSMAAHGARRLIGMIENATAVISGVAKRCELGGCALIGGETAEMPGMYPHDEYDLAGFAVGIVEKDRIISGATIQAGDIVLGLASSGAHSNGYSLIRKIIENNRIDLSADFHGKPLANTIMMPTRIYVKPVLELIKQLPVKGLAHITGGGLVENVPRILPDQVMAVLQKDAWEMPPLFHWLQQQGNVADHEMARVFNCGIGMVIVVAPDHAENALRSLRASGETVWQIGEIKPRTNNQAATVLV